MKLTSCKTASGTMTGYTGPISVGKINGAGASRGAGGAWSASVGLFGLDSAGLFSLGLGNTRGTGRVAATDGTG